MVPLSIVYQDHDLMVIDKPPNLVTTPSETQKEPTLADILHSEYTIDIERSGVVHRLDKDTSGLLLVAKNEPTFLALQSQFKDRIVDKTYTALVHGFLEKSGIIEGAITRNPGDRQKFIVQDDGKEASTKYQPITKYQMSQSEFDQIFTSFNKIQLRKLDKSNYQFFTLVSLHPLTGRTHQIRVHLKSIGFPIVGDSKYGGRKTSRLDARWCPRQFLHASKISFNHPKTGNRLNFTSPLPTDLLQVLSKLQQV